MFKSSCIPFKQDSFRYLLPWMSFFVVFILVFIVKGTFVVINTLDYWQNSLTSSATIKIPTYTQDGIERKEQVQQDINQVLELTKNYTGIKDVNVLSNSEVHQLMSEWVSPDTDISLLPLPKLLDVQLTEEGIDFDKLTLELSEHVPSAVLDTHQSWFQEFIVLTQKFSKIIFIFVLLLLLTIIFTSAYVTKASLKVHQNIIELIYRMGATDFFIMWQYAFRSFLMSYAGAFIGSIFAFCVVFLAGELIDISSLFIPCNFRQNSFNYFLIPLFVSIFTFIITLVTVRRYLRKFA